MNREKLNDIKWNLTMGNPIPQEDRNALAIYLEAVENLHNNIKWDLTGTYRVTDSETLYRIDENPTEYIFSEGIVSIVRGEFPGNYEGKYPDDLESVVKGLDQSSRGETHDLGSFSDSQ
jgi:hypothetical protein